MLIIKDQKIQNDPWVIVEGEKDKQTGDHIIMPFEQFTLKKEQIPGRKYGIVIETDQDPDLVKPYLDDLELIAIHFKKFNDGRGYTQARTLRSRYNFNKEIRAIGDVMRDQLFYLERCGFNAFAIKEGQDIHDALQGLHDFSITYQPSCDEPLPLYRRK